LQLLSNATLNYVPPPPLKPYTSPCLRCVFLLGTICTLGRRMRFESFPVPPPIRWSRTVHHHPGSPPAGLARAHGPLPAEGPELAWACFSGVLTSGSALARFGGARDAQSPAGSQTDRHISPFWMVGVEALPPWREPAPALAPHRGHVVGRGGAALLFAPEAGSHRRTAQPGNWLRSAANRMAALIFSDPSSSAKGGEGSPVVQAASTMAPEAMIPSRRGRRAI